MAGQAELQDRARGSDRVQPARWCIAPVRDALHGTWSGHPLHPMLTDVPVGAWTATLMLDAVDSVRRRDDGYRQAAATTVGVGVVGGLASVLTGLTDCVRSPKDLHFWLL